MHLSGHMKGQISIVNLLVLLVVIIFYLLGGLPILNEVIADAILEMDAQVPAVPNAEVIKLLMGLIPLFILIAIIMTAFIYAIPKREGGTPYGQF